MTPYQMPSYLEVRAKGKKQITFLQEYFTIIAHEEKKQFFTTTKMFWIVCTPLSLWIRSQNL